MKLLFAIIALCVTAPVFANGTVVAKVIQVRIDKNGWGMVMFDQPLGSSPATCAHSSYANALAFDTNTAAGKSIMALALAAKATGDTVSAYGTATCTIYGGSWVEDWAYGVTQ